MRVGIRRGRKKLNNKSKWNPNVCIPNTLSKWSNFEGEISMIYHFLCFHKKCILFWLVMNQNSSTSSIKLNCVKKEILIKDLKVIATFTTRVVRCITVKVQQVMWSKLDSLPGTFSDFPTSRSLLPIIFIRISHFL